MRSTEILYLLTMLFSSNFVCIQMQGTRSGSHAMKILQHDKILKFPSVIYLFSLTTWFGILDVDKLSSLLPFLQLLSVVLLQLRGKKHGLLQAMTIQFLQGEETIRRMLL